MFPLHMSNQNRTLYYGDLRGEAEAHDRGCCCKEQAAQGIKEEDHRDDEVNV